jgi:hypothetical protein
MSVERKEYLREYAQRKSSKENQRLRNAKWRGEDEIRALKTVPCADCGKAYPHYVMDFDHRPGETKLFDISRHQWGAKRRLEEAKKCDVVCANCHRERTHSRGIR